MKLILTFSLIIALLFAAASCKKDKPNADQNFTYYQVGFNFDYSDRRDTAFVVRTSDPELIRQLDAELLQPISLRKLVVGTLVAGSGGYNKNAAHEFKWHLKEDDWQLTDITIEIYDGRPYSDVDQDISYWLQTVKRYGSWGSYVKKKLPSKP